MFTYKFVGLEAPDSITPWYFGSLPSAAAVGHLLIYVESNNRYVVDGVCGEGLPGDGGHADQSKLAWADINRGEDVPTLILRRLDPEVVVPEVAVFKSTRDHSFEEMKEYSQENRAIRHSAGGQNG
jgi:hypothetical protein